MTLYFFALKPRLALTLTSWAMCYAMEKGTSGFGKTQCTQVVKTIWVQRILLIFTFYIAHR